MDDRSIGEVLRSLREERGETLREVTTDPVVGMDVTLLSHIENHRRLPTPTQLEGLARHYGVPVGDLVPHLETSLSERARARWSRSPSPSRTRPSRPPAAAPQDEPLRGGMSDGLLSDPAPPAQGGLFPRAEIEMSRMIPSLELPPEHVYESVGGLEEPSLTGPSAAVTAVEALAGSAAGALAALKALARDPDPEVSAAAKAALTRLRREAR